MSAPFYEITFPLDVTGLKIFAAGENISFYYALCYQCTQIMSGIDAFLTRIRRGQVVRYGRLHPGCTDRVAGTDRFLITRLVQDGDMISFCRDAVKKRDAQKTFIGKDPVDGEQYIYYTCLPWTPFSALHNVPQADRDDTVPRVSFGKFQRDPAGRLILPCSVAVNLRLVEGIHVGEF